MYVFHIQTGIDISMNINDTEVKRMWQEEVYGYGSFRKPTITDDLAYSLYCKDKVPESCIIQRTFIYEKNVLYIKNYYDYAERILKLEKVKSNIKQNENR